MKLETLGWWVFLVSIVIFVVTLIYAFGKFIVSCIYDLLVAYNHNVVSILIWSAVVSLIGIGIIKLGASRDQEEF